MVGVQQETSADRATTVLGLKQARTVMASTGGGSLTTSLGPVRLQGRGVRRRPALDQAAEVARLLRVLNLDPSLQPLLAQHQERLEARVAKQG